MTVQYTNRKRITYYLHEDNTKTGKDRYYFSTKDEGNLVDALPEGYEIYEHPYSQVFLRKVHPQPILTAERQLIDEYFNKIKSSRQYLADVNGKVVTIFMSNEDVDFLKEIISAARPEGFSIESALNFSLSYVSVIRFILKNEETRTFIVQQFTFPGCENEWIDIGGPDSLENLFKSVVPLSLEAEEIKP